MSSLTLTLLKANSKKGVKLEENVISRVISVEGHRYLVQSSNNQIPIPSDEQLEIYVKGTNQLYGGVSPRMNMTIPDIPKPEEGGQSELLLSTEPLPLTETPNYIETTGPSYDEEPQPVIRGHDESQKGSDNKETLKQNYKDIMDAELSGRGKFSSQIPWEENPFRYDEPTTGEDYKEEYDGGLSVTVPREVVEEIPWEDDPFRTEQERNYKAVESTADLDDVPFGIPSIVL